jgi:hypothetical protein
MSDLREQLDLYVGLLEADRVAYERVLRRAARRRLRRRLAAGATALAVTSLAFSLLWSASRSGPDRAVSYPTSTAPTAPPRVLSVGLRTHVDGWVVLAYPFGVRVAGAGTVTAVDPETGRTIPAGHGTWDYDYTSLADDGEGTIWVASGHTLSEVAGESPPIASYDLGSLGYLGDVLQAGGETWVTASGNGGVLARIDPDTGHVVARYELDRTVLSLASVGRYIFVGRDRFDPASGEIVPVPGLGSDAVVASAGGNLWAAENGVVRCIDPTLLSTCGDVSIPRASMLASNAERLWVLSVNGSTSRTLYEPDPNQPATVTLVDGSTGEVLADALPLPSGEHTPASISAFDGHAWIGFHDTGTLIRIDTCEGDCPLGASQVSSSSASAVTSSSSASRSTS